MKKTVRKKVAASRQTATEKPDEAEDTVADGVDEGVEHDEVREGVVEVKTTKKKKFCRRRPPPRRRRCPWDDPVRYP